MIRVSKTERPTAGTEWLKSRGSAHRPVIEIQLTVSRDDGKIPSDAACEEVLAENDMREATEVFYTAKATDRVFVLRVRR